MVTVETTAITTKGITSDHHAAVIVHGRVSSSGGGAVRSSLIAGTVRGVGGDRVLGAGRVEVDVGGRAPIPQLRPLAGTVGEPDRDRGGTGRVGLVVIFQALFLWKNA